MWSGVHAAAEAHDHPHRAARDNVVEVQRMMISNSVAAEDHVEVRVLREDEVQLEADLQLQLKDDVPAVDVVDGDSFARERLDEGLRTAA